MSSFLNPVKTLSEAWVRGLEDVISSPGGRQVHLVTTVTDPGSEIDEIREVLDLVLSEAGEQSIDTVAQTIFPRALYEDLGFDWAPNMPDKSEEAINSAADQLYQRYLSMLPLLRTDPANRQGTYFSRMISWPGRDVNGVNQLQSRILRLRSERKNGRRTHNTLDIDLAAYCIENGPPPLGVQTYAVNDNRIRGFPCLVHLDFTLLEGRLHCAAIYRHHHLISKAYGNYLGLSWLMQFLCQQSGCEIGELVVHATLADAQKGYRVRPVPLLKEIRTALDSAKKRDVG